ncbi:helix-turn-helix domain-containing protein [Halomicrobium urmianum]|uniref:helix-turn-helix domain-containing protein n=1 Tax=Halomicrobium urmianum TaxID=1586233 RepID=UPI001CD959D5|nr:helix-turn-helix domain-containing protein [Halomicrobium urmianum]
MSVIADLRVPARDFTLGEVLAVHGEATVTLETMVPIGERTVPLFWVTDEARPTFEREVRDHETVESIHQVEVEDGKTLYALEWSATGDSLFSAFLDTDASLLHATAASEFWQFQARFQTHADLAAFKRRCDEADVTVEVNRIYNPTRPDSGPHYGLTEPQREALVEAVRKGYYAIPRRISTKALAEELDISDQATTERLRRAIITLVEHTLLAVEEEVDR